MAAMRTRPNRSIQHSQKSVGLVTVTTKALVVIVVALVAFLALQGQDARVALLIALIAALATVIPVFWDELVPEHEGLPLAVVLGFWEIFSDRNVWRGVLSIGVGAFAFWAANTGISVALGIFNSPQQAAQSAFGIAVFGAVVFGVGMWVVLRPRSIRSRSRRRR